MNQENKPGRRGQADGGFVSSYFGSGSRSGTSIRCQFCVAQRFYRSTLRSDDLGQVMLMRYPVRCAECGRRQMTSFAVAAASMSKPKHKRSAEDHSGSKPVAL
jgi:hypothetical protein